MKRFTLRYLLVEIALFALAMGLFREVFLTRDFDSLILGLPMFMAAFLAAVGGLFGRRGMFTGAISGLILGCVGILWLLWTVPS